MQTAPVLILWQNPLFRETVQAILAEAGISANVTASAFNNGALPEGSRATRFIIAEGDRDVGHRILEAWKPDDNLQVLAFTMDNDRAHLWRYQAWPGITRSDIVQLLDPP